MGFLKKMELTMSVPGLVLSIQGRGASAISNPLEIDDATLIKGSRLIENLWLILNKGDMENLESFACNILENSYLEKFSKLEHDKR